MRFRTLLGACLAALSAASPNLDARPADEPQRRPVPRPFPRPGQSEPDRGEARPPAENPSPAALAATPTTAQAVTPATAQAVTPTTAQAGTAAAPTEETLGFPIYPAAQFITSYDAGQGQGYYLFGADIGFDALVRYYRNVLDDRGDRVFDEPPTHIFEVGRFREREMAFPPSVTIKDYAWNGSEGYPDPAGGRRFRTVIQIVPPPPASSR